MTTLSPGWQGWDLWVTARTLRTPEGVERLIRFVQEHPVHALYVQGVVGGYAYYPSRLLPRTRYHAGDPGFDPVQTLLDSLPHHPIHLWINAMLWWTVEDPPEDSTHLLYTHPEWFVHDDQGRNITSYTYKSRVLAGVDGLFLNPWAPGVPEFLAQVAGEAVERYPRLAGIHLDFIRYPGNRFGYDPQKVQMFREEYGVDPRWIPAYLRGWNPRWLLQGDLNPVERWLTLLHLRWNEVRVAGIRRVVEAVQHAVKRHDSRYVVSAAVFPNPATARLLLGQDWTGWIRGGILDRAVIMGYTPDPHRYLTYLHYWRNISPRNAVSPGIGIWFPHPERYLLKELQLLRGTGFQQVTVFDYGSLTRRNRTLRMLLADSRFPRAETLPPYPLRDRHIYRRPGTLLPPDQERLLRERVSALSSSLTDTSYESLSVNRLWSFLVPSPLDQVIRQELGLSEAQENSKLQRLQEEFQALQNWMVRHPLPDTHQVWVPEFRTYRRIWLPFPPLPRFWERWRVRLQAWALLLRYRMGTPFASLAQRYSHHASRRWGGEGPWIWNTGTSRLEQAVFSLPEEGAVTLLETEHGILLIQLAGRRPAHRAPWGELRGEERAAAFLYAVLHRLLAPSTKEVLP